MSKKVIDYYKDGQHLLRIGKVNYDKAQKPLETHIHQEQMEIVVIIKGSQIYHIEGVQYEVKSGEAFCAYPNEEHGSANNPEDKAYFYYLIFNVEQLIKQSILCDEREVGNLRSLMNGEKKHLVQANKSIQEYCKKLMELCCDNSLMKHSLIRNFLSLLVIELFSIKENEHNSEEHELDFILEYIHQHIGETIALEELAKRYGVSLSRFKSLFRKKVGMPPREYILREKIKIAKKLLKTTTKNVTEIAMELGFDSGQYFATVFKRYTYQTPKEYRSKNCI